MTILKDAIRSEGLYDEKNPSIIMCSPDLEESLGMKALHVTQIRYCDRMVWSGNALFSQGYRFETIGPNTI